MANNQSISRLLAAFRQSKLDLPLLIGQRVERFFKLSFVKQGFTDNGFDAWQKRKRETNFTTGKKVLSGDGFLADSINLTSYNWNRIVIKSTGVKYAQIHNDGGITHPTVTLKMRRWAWAMYHQTGDPMFKGIALTKKSKLDVKIPQRKFMGNSKTLERGIEKLIKFEIDNLIKRIK
jgi:phage gpG-like protein